MTSKNDNIQNEYWSVNMTEENTINIQKVIVDSSISAFYSHLYWSFWEAYAEAWCINSHYRSWNNNKPFTLIVS